MNNQNNEIQVGIVGVGGCASSLLQSIQESKDKPQNCLTGIQHWEIGGYTPSDIVLQSAIDIDERKVGLKVSDAITFAKSKIFHKLREDVEVHPGVVLDGISGPLEEVVPAVSREANEGAISEYWKNTGTRIVICYLPTGAADATQFYSRVAAKSGVAFINANPETVANSPEIAALFKQNRVPLLGDDIRSHFGSSALHMALIELMETRGLSITETFQLNVGGNDDFLNLSDQSRSASKVKSKLEALRRSSSAAAIKRSYAGPNGYIEHLDDSKICYLNIVASSVLGSQVSLDVKLKVEDSPNAAGTMLNAIRVAQVAIDRGESGLIDDVCAFLFKNPVEKANERVSFQRFLEYIKQ